MTNLLFRQLVSAVADNHQGHRLFFFFRALVPIQWQQMWWRPVSWTRASRKSRIGTEKLVLCMIHGNNAIKQATYTQKRSCTPDKTSTYAQMSTERTTSNAFPAQHKRKTTHKQRKTKRKVRKTKKKNEKRKRKTGKKKRRFLSHTNDSFLLLLLYVVTEKETNKKKKKKYPQDTSDKKIGKYCEKKKRTFSGCASHTR